MDTTSVLNAAQASPIAANRNVSEGFSASTAKTVATPVEVDTTVQQPASIPSLEQTKQAIDTINKNMKATGQSLEFSIDKDNRAIVKVMDPKTKEVIRQMPSQETLEIAKLMTDSPNNREPGMLIKLTS
jgi:flagellar protein FlaG